MKKRSQQSPRPQAQPVKQTEHTKVTEPAAVPDGIKPDPNQPGATASEPEQQQKQ